jgi:hypothetical protein
VTIESVPREHHDRDDQHDDSGGDERHHPLPRIR